MQDWVNNENWVIVTCTYMKGYISSHNYSTLSHKIFTDSIADGTWTWAVETTSTYTNWAPGLPTNTYAQTDCAYMATSKATPSYSTQI